MFTNNKLAKSVRLAIAFGAAATALPATHAFAADEEVEEVERIEVTGSRLKSTDLEGANPVTILSRDDLLATGITDVGDLIQRMPAMSGSPIGTTTNNGGSGAVTVNLRGLGSIRTLVLINGKRTVDGGDFQTIPSAMIKRVEILKDGASAIYGADAVAGVINVITRDDFEGVEVNYQNSDSLEADAGLQETFSFLAGKTFDGGNIVFGAEYVEQEAVYQSDTPWDFFQHSYFITEADADNCAFCEDGVYWENLGFSINETVIGFGSSRIPTGNFNTIGGENLTIDPVTGEFRPYNGAWWDPTNDSYNYAPVNYIQTPYDKLNVFVEGSFDVSETTSFFGAVRLNRRTSAQELAPVPFDTNSDPGYPINILDDDGNVTDTRFGISADNYYNPLGEDIIRVRRRMAEAPRRFTNEVSQMQAIMGFEGEILDGDWTWDASYNYGNRHVINQDFGQYFGPNLEKALGPSFLDDNGNVVCGTPDEPIAGCVSMNLFGGTGTVTQEMLDYVGVVLNDTVEAETQIFTANITGELGELPAGPIGVAFGYEYRDQKLRTVNDSSKTKGLVTGNKGSGTSGSYNVSSIYSEFLFPLLDDGDMTAEATLGLRYDDYSTFGGNTTYQAGVKFQPIDGLLLRATYGEVFREPGIGELFAGQSDGFPTVNAPCNTDNYPGLTAEQQANCRANGVPEGGWNQTDTQILARTGGNPNLNPEEGDTLTVGVAWSPDFIEGFSMTLDYWSIEIESLIAALGAGSILNACALQGNDVSCAAINRRSDGSIQSVEALADNLALAKAEGVDLEFNLDFELGFGELKTSLLWTHALTREATEFEGAETDDLLGTHLLDFGSTYATDKFNFAADLFMDNISISYLAEYIGEIEGDTNFWSTGNRDEDFLQQIDAQLYHDIAASYDFEFGTRVTLGLTNITNEAPPYIDAGFNASTDPSTYRMFGRSYYLRLSHNF